MAHPSSGVKFKDTERHPGGVTSVTHTHTQTRAPSADQATLAGQTTLNPQHMTPVRLQAHRTVPHWLGAVSGIKANICTTDFTEA